MKKLITTTLCVLLGFNPAFAADVDIGPSSTEDMFRSRISEYFYSRTGNEVLQPVKIIGSVGKPGMYHVPPNTDLDTLMAISGGTGKSADHGNVLVTRADGSSEEIDFFDYVKSGEKKILNSGDTVYVPEQWGFFDPRTQANLIVLSSFITVILTAHLAFK